MLSPEKEKMAKRKVDIENRVFQERWEAEYMFTDMKGKPICLVCGADVAVTKEYKLRRHYETRHLEVQGYEHSTEGSGVQMKFGVTADYVY